MVAYFFVLSFGLGSLALILLHNTTGGAWGDAIRRPLEAAVGTLPVLALAFLPVLLGMGYLYEWSDPSIVARDPLLKHKEPVVRGDAVVALGELYEVDTKPVVFKVFCRDASPYVQFRAWQSLRKLVQ